MNTCQTIQNFSIEFIAFHFKPQIKSVLQFFDNIFVEKWNAIYLTYYCKTASIRYNRSLVIARAPEHLVVYCLCRNTLLQNIEN